LVTLMSSSTFVLVNPFNIRVAAQLAPKTKSTIKIIKLIGRQRWLLGDTLVLRLFLLRDVIGSE
jgi:hypothetical protein